MATPIVVLGEDAHRLYVEKPPGLTVFPPHADPLGDCVLARVLERWPERVAGWPVGFEGGIAHRLDTLTRGLLVMARTPADLPALREEFAGGRLRKHYRFHSAGDVPWDDRVVTDELAHHPNRKDRMVWRRGPRTTHRGKWYPAWTRFARVGDGWWTAEIRTGVMHQIRVHALSVGLPLDGDAIYGGAPGEFTLEATRIEAPGWRFGA